MFRNPKTVLVSVPWLSLAVCTSLILLVVVLPGSVQAKEPQPLAAPCNPLGLTACGLPFPSDLYTVPDTSSPTGRRVDVSDEIVTDAYRALVPVTGLPSRVLDGATGFSAAGPVLFELDAAPDRATLPLDGGEALVVFDLDAGTRVSVRVEMDADAARSAQPSAVVRAWPAVRFAHGHRIVAALTTSLRRSDGTAYEPPPGVREVVEGGRSPVSRHCAGVLDFLESKGVEPETLVSLTDFTVRAASDARADMLRAVQTASQWRHPVRIDAVQSASRPPGAVTVYGRVRLTNFQEPDGTFVPDGPGHAYWTTFQPLVPPAAVEAPVPVAIYGHGFAGNKTRMIEMSVQNALHGVATIAIDWSYRGTRVLIDGDYVLLLDRPADQAKFSAMFLQGVVDIASLRAALGDELARLDVLPPGSAARNDPGRSGDGAPDLRGDHVIYQGTSYGGMLGAALLGVVPELDGGILNVCGIGLMDTFVHLPIWFWGAVGRVVPHGGPGTDTALDVALLQHALDPADGANYADLYREPLDGGPARPVLLQYGEDDGIVRNVTSEALVALAALPEVERSPEGAVSFVDGYGWNMVTNPGNIPETLWPFAAHSFTASLPAGREVSDAWLAEYVGALGPSGS